MAKTDELLVKYKQMVLRYNDKVASVQWWFLNSSRPELGVFKISEGPTDISHITGYEKISIRSYDDTPSTSITEKLAYTDFGDDGVKKDPLTRVIEVTGCSFRSALEQILSWENDLPDSFVPTATISTKSNEKRKPFGDRYLREMIINKSKFKDNYDFLAKDLFRSCSVEEQKLGERLLSIGFTPKSEYQVDDRLFIPEFNEKKVPLGSYRYNRNIKGKKGLIRKDSQRVIFGSHLLSTFNTNIIYSEGHTDTVVNISKSLGCITTGAATKAFEERISLLAGKHIHDFPDLDIPGMVGAFKRGVEIDIWNLNNPDNQIKHTIYWWSTWFGSSDIANKIKLNNISNTDLFKPIVNSIPIKNGQACFNLEIMSFIQKEYAKKKRFDISKRLDIRNWILLSNKVKPSGYDFIDFHTENKDSEKYNLFLEKFKF